MGGICMGFWLFMFFSDLLIPIMMIGFGKYFFQSPPREINSAFGYRTSMSMKNKDTWEFAHHFIGKLWFTWGCILFPVSIIPFFFFIGKGLNEIGVIGSIICIIQLLFLVGSIFPTERALRRTFDADGKRK